MRRRRRIVVLCLGMASALACGAPVDAPAPGETEIEANPRRTLAAAREGFVTTIVRDGDASGPPESPEGSEFDLVRYTSPVGDLAAYVTRDPGDGGEHPAIVWIVGGDSSTIADVWTPQPRDNDQSASAFREAGIVMMFPSLRGGNDNPGRREGFLGEVDDILAAADHLAALPYVDSERVYLGGHSTGGTLALLVAATSSRFRAVFSLGPIAATADYGGDFVYCDPTDQREMILRSPVYWLDSIETPTYVFEGGVDGTWEWIEWMVSENENEAVRFFEVPGHDHFTVIAPLAERLAEQIVEGRLDITEEMIANLR